MFVRILAEKIVESVKIWLIELNNITLEVITLK